jgi:NADPH-dependent 7-cyano-7-deazaguanine reductase QueF
VHRCPHVPEVDAGEADIVWRCGEVSVELHSLAAYLASWQSQTISHEEITEQIRADLDALEGIEVLGVVTRWRTAGLAVEVSA